MILELKGIYKDYQQGKMIVPVLKDVNFSMEEGEYVAIMGPSGSGKSTLMNIIGCLDQATKGTFFLDGQDISKCSENEMSDIRLNKIGFVFQSFHLLPRQSAISNVEMPLNYAHVPKKERRERAFAALDRVGLADRVDFRPNQLSGGQMQRVAIARAIVNNPRLLLADEPTGALDSKSGRQVMELFQKLNDEGVSVLMITHDPDIAAHAKRVVMIRDGELQEKRCTLDDVCACAFRLLKDGGRLALCHRPERLAEVLDVLRAHRLEPKRLAFVKNRADAAPWLFLVEAQKNRKTGLRVEPDVLISAGAALYGR